MQIQVATFKQYFPTVPYAVHTNENIEKCLTVIIIILKKNNNNNQTKNDNDNNNEDNNNSNNKIIILIRHFLLEHSLGLSNSNYENVKRAISRGAAWGS